MANADQIKALLTAHASGDSAQFYSIAMQIAASEARQGRGKFAEELRLLIDKSKSRATLPSAPIPLNRPRGELADILSVSYPKTKLADMVLSTSVESRLHRVIREQRSVNPIRHHGLAPRRKLMLVGKPGTGKTLTASALAGELGIPLFIVHLDGLITKYMGETAAKLRLVFEAIAQTRAVYLFDEFDSIGSERGLSNDVGEIRRVVSSFLQMVEQDHSESLIIAATNHIALLDRALFRRFDDIIRFELPNAERAKKLLQTKLGGFKPSKIMWSSATRAARGLSYADIARATEDAIKDVIIQGKESVSKIELIKALNERRDTLKKKGASD
jgi:SpoVK/Ycf46/Vps4 family AAA+-type ATPase